MPEKSAKWVFFREKTHRKRGLKTLYKGLEAIHFYAWERKFCFASFDKAEHNRIAPLSGSANKFGD
jgi:hypothetical protein